MHVHMYVYICIYAGVRMCVCMYVLYVCMYICMLNKNTLGVKKVRGQSEATCKQAGATKSYDIS